MVLQNVLHTLTSCGQDGQPCQHGPKSICLPDMVSTLWGRQQSLHYLVSEWERWMQPNTPIAPRDSTVASNPACCGGEAVPAPKLSSPHKDSLPPSIRLPKKFHPGGVSYSSILVAFATLQWKKWKSVPREPFEHWKNTVIVVIQRQMSWNDDPCTLNSLVFISREQTQSVTKYLGIAPYPRRNGDIGIDTKLWKPESIVDLTSVRVNKCLSLAP